MGRSTTFATPNHGGVMSNIPSSVRCARYWLVAQMSAIKSRPPGRSTRTASSIARCPAGPAFDVVNRHAGDDQIEAVSIEGQRGHIGRMQVDTVRHSLGGGVAPGRIGRIARLVFSVPEVDADRSAGRQVLGGHQQHRTTSAPHVQDPLIASQGELVEQLGPDHELAPTRGVQATACAGRHERADTNGHGVPEMAPSMMLIAMSTTGMGNRYGASTP